jgi:hypothetical protein
MAERTILVEGGGIAALCCQQLLHGQCYTGASAVAKTPRLPAILVSQSTQKLLADIFQSADLFEGFPHIRERVVAWRPGNPVRLPHSAVVASEKVLLDRLRARLAEGERQEEDPEHSLAWRIFSAGAAPLQELEQMHFGSRTAVVRQVELAGNAQPDACWIESVENGWLFLLPTLQGQGSLISVGSETRRLLSNSRLVVSQVQSIEESVVAEFAAYPRILSRLCGDRGSDKAGAGWLACGSAAMSFDPLCGEGAGNAAREAILASAALKAILAGESREDVLSEYSMRLMLGFLRHLENCREFYRPETPSEFWRAELQSIESGIVWTKQQLEGRSPRFRLMDFTLERIANPHKPTSV